MPPSPSRLHSEVVVVRREGDLVAVRLAVQAMAGRCGLGRVDTTRIVTAASELGCNILFHAGLGTIRVELRRRAGRLGVGVVAEDDGPGIGDLQGALVDGFSTGGTLGVGLGGTRRLVDEFRVQSHPDHGTRVEVIRWRR